MMQGQYSRKRGSPSHDIFKTL